MPQNIVITMAGRGSRFYDAGYTVPKYEIMAHGRSLFSWSMLSLQHFLQQDSQLIFVCLAENKSAPYIREQANALGISRFHIVELDQITDGQATSAYVTREHWHQDAPLLIYNIDTYVHPRALQPAQIRPGSDGWIPCFTVPGEHWSFVRLGADGWADKITEKTRISDHASIGLYWFAQAREYLSAYEAFFSAGKNLVKGERYVAPLYSHFLEQGKKISVSDLPPSDVHVLGTPLELQEFLHKDASSIYGGE